MTGQPRSAAQCIQGSSRIGRERPRPGLLVTISQWTRPRDLAHLESFGYDHATFGLRIEGLTTTPFSDRALDRGLTGVLVTAMRHSGIPALPNTAAQTVPLTGPGVAGLLDGVQHRAEVVTQDTAQGQGVRQQLQHRLDSWHGARRAVATGRLGYKEAADVTGLLLDPDIGSWTLWSVPNSLREVEPEITLQLDRPDRSLEDAPTWDYQRAPAAGAAPGRPQQAAPRGRGPAGGDAAASPAPTGSADVGGGG